MLDARIIILEWFDFGMICVAGAVVDGALSPNERKEKHRLALLRLVLFLAVMCYNAYA